MSNSPKAGQSEVQDTKLDVEVQDTKLDADINKNTEGAHAMPPPGQKDPSSPPDIKAPSVGGENPVTFKFHAVGNQQTVDTVDYNVDGSGGYDKTDG